MFSQEIELRGHIIDFLTLPKVLDEILSHAGNFKIRQIPLSMRAGFTSNHLPRTWTNVC
jgi:hypothetical protein